MRNPVMILLMFSLSMVGGLAYSQVVNPVISTSPTDGNADDPAIWIHPTDAARSVIIGTDKDAGIYVWNMNGEELQHLEQGTTCNNVDVRYGIQLNGQFTDVIALNLRDAGKLAVFKVNPNYTNGDVLNQIAGENSATNDIQGNSYGFALYRAPADGALYVFECPETDCRLRVLPRTRNWFWHNKADTHFAVTALPSSPPMPPDFGLPDPVGLAPEESLQILPYYTAG